MTKCLPRYKWKVGGWRAENGVSQNSFSLNLIYKKAIVAIIVIDKKRYVLIPEKDFQALQKKAALKTKPEKLLTIEDAKTQSKKLIRQWATENPSLQNPNEKA
jgi:hypothetical protein